MNVQEALLESWDRQCDIVNSVATRVTDENRHFKPSEDGWSLDLQLAHIHGVRRFWLSHVDPERAATLKSAYKSDGEAIDDLATIKSYVEQSGRAVRDAMKDHLDRGTQEIKTENVTYDHPVLFLQHMVWHEGWHVGLIFLALRIAGQEPGEEWEEPNVWGKWRTERW